MPRIWPYHIYLRGWPTSLGWLFCLTFQKEGKCLSRELDQVSGMLMHRLVLTTCCMAYAQAQDLVPAAIRIQSSKMRLNLRGNQNLVLRWSQEAWARGKSCFGRTCLYGGHTLDLPPSCLLVLYSLFFLESLVTRPRPGETAKTCLPWLGPHSQTQSDEGDLRWSPARWFQDAICSLV